MKLILILMRGINKKKEDILKRVFILNKLYVIKEIRAAR